MSFAKCGSHASWTQPRQLDLSMCLACLIPDPLHTPPPAPWLSNSLFTALFVHFNWTIMKPVWSTTLHDSAIMLFLRCFLTAGRLWNNCCPALCVEYLLYMFTCWCTLFFICVLHILHYLPLFITHYSFVLLILYFITFWHIHPSIHPAIHPSLRSLLFT